MESGVSQALEAKKQDVSRMQQQANLAKERVDSDAVVQEEVSAAAVLAADESLQEALSQWEEVVNQLATKETIMCTLDARIASLKADVLAQVSVRMLGRERSTVHERRQEKHTDSPPPPRPSCVEKKPGFDQR